MCKGVCECEVKVQACGRVYVNGRVRQGVGECEGVCVRVCGISLEDSSGQEVKSTK